MTYAPEETPGSGLPGAEEQRAPRRTLGCALEIVETLVLTVIIYLVIHNFVAQPFEVRQQSMVPTIAEREYILIDKLTPRFAEYARGDIVVFQPPSSSPQVEGIPFIKRVIGLPGDTVQLINGRVFVTPPGGSATRIEEPYIGRTFDGRPVETQPKPPDFTAEWRVPDGQYFVMGDNRGVSEDSRVFGPIDRELIVGRAWLRYFPLDRIGFMSNPDYAGLDEAVSAILLPPARRPRSTRRSRVHSRAGARRRTTVPARSAPSRPHPMHGSGCAAH
jgi:signal peptidase I